MVKIGLHNGAIDTSKSKMHLGSSDQAQIFSLHQINLFDKNLRKSIAMTLYIVVVAVLFANW